jgi:hypothetical protein
MQGFASFAGIYFLQSGVLKRKVANHLSSIRTTRVCGRYVDEGFKERKVREGEQALVSFLRN